MAATAPPEVNREIPVLRAHMQELDSVRGVAILMVLFYHGFHWGIDFSRFPPIEKIFSQAAWAGRLGVNLFFVLSGFLITGLLLKAKETGKYYRKFYIRRGLRILPAYAVTLLVLAVTGTPMKFIGLSLVYLSNFTLLFGVASAYPVLWSLAVEEHFYLLWPIVVRRLTGRSLLAVCVGIVLLSPLMRWITFEIAARQGWVSYQIFNYSWNSADGLACGGLLAVWLREFAPSRRTFSKVLLGVVAGGMALLPFSLFSKHGAVGAAMQVVPWNLVFAGMTGAALLAGSRWGDRVRQRWLEFFGEISYGLYLYHLLVFQGFEQLVNKGIIPRLHIDPFLGLSIRFVICGGVATGIAYLSRRYLEEPFLRLKTRLAP